MTIEEKLIFIKDPEKREIRFEDDGYVRILLKVAYNDCIDFLYLQEHYHASHPLRREANMEYAGFVHYPSGRVFDTCYKFFRFNEGFVGISLSTLVEECKAAIIEMLLKRIDNKPLPVTELAEETRRDRESFLKYEVQRHARSAFFDGKEKVKYTPHIDPTCNTEDYIQMVMDMNAYAKIWADTYLLQKAKCINDRLWELGEEQKELDKLRITPGIHHMTLAIANSIDGDMKMVNLHIDKEGKKMVTKYAASHLRNADTYDYMTFHMDAPGNRQFEALYGRGARLNPNDIQSITYGKKVLYSREE